MAAKAEQIEDKENPRCLVTSLQAVNWPAQKLYEELYCARGDMENRIKEQYSLFAGRLSAATLRANQLRLYLSAAAYVLMSGFRRLALSATVWARAQCDTIRLQLLRVGTQVGITARRVWLSIASSYPHARALRHHLSTTALLKHEAVQFFDNASSSNSSFVAERLRKRLLRLAPPLLRPTTHADLLAAGRFL